MGPWAAELWALWRTAGGPDPIWRLLGRFH